MNYEILQKHEFEKVGGEIYKITNTITNKCYVGQTRTHRLNRGKYRPFGYLGRFKDHISESRSNKPNQSKLLNSSIIKHGDEKFTCELITTCKLEELDELERKYIKEYNSKYPNGYNLSDGGQHIGIVKCPIDIVIERPPVVNKLPKKHSEHTKKLISENIKKAINTEHHLNKMAYNAQKQHLNRKFLIFEGVEFDASNIEKLITIKEHKYVQVKIGNKVTNFTGKNEEIESMKTRAIHFIEELVKRRRNQIAGSPLEPALPLVDGNIDEELG